MSVRSMRYVVCAAAALALSPVTASAQVKAGPEFRANTFTTGYQVVPTLGVQANGDFIVVWVSDSQDGSNYGIFGQRYNRDGSPKGAEFQANSFTTGAQALPRVAVNKAGKFVVVWQSDYQNGLLGIFGQRFDATGARVGAEFQVNTDTAGYQYRGDVAVDAQGGFVVTWTSTEGDGAGGYGIRAQRFGPTGARVGVEFSVNTYTTGYQDQAHVSGTPDGRFVVVWESSGQDGNSYGVFGQRFDAAGAKVGAEFQANTYTTGSQQDPSVGMTPDGRFIVGWESNQGGIEIRSQRYDASGNRVGTEFAVNTYTTGSQFLYSVAVDAQGNYVMVWDDLARDGDSYGDFGWRISSNDTRRGAEFQANTYTTGYQGLGFVGSDEVGNFVVVWHSDGQDGSYFGVFGQRFGGLFPTVLDVNTAGNRVWEPGETVDVRPTWRNLNGAPQTFAGTLTNLTGPAGATYTLGDGIGNYGTVANNTSAPCTDCYQVSVDNPTRPVQHWDASALESITPDTQGQQKRWMLHIGGSFADVPNTNPFYRFIETLLHVGVTGGCGGTNYCPSTATTRDQMSVFVLVAKEGAGYAPPACAPPNIFADVPETSPFCRYIEDLANRGVVGGCGGGNYCPTSPVTREQMCIFVLRTLDPALNPPACGTPLFNDVPASSPFCKWIEELARRGVVTGCGAGNYCPTQSVTREQMGVFLGATFNLTLYGT